MLIHQSTFAQSYGVIYGEPFDFDGIRSRKAERQVAFLNRIGHRAAQARC